MSGKSIKHASRNSRSSHTLTVAPMLSVVVVNYCQWRQTTQLIRQLRRCSSLREGQSEIVLVDNHSPAHPVLAGLRRLSGLSVRRWRRNFGFARAVNEGCRLSRGRWLLLLNPDVTIDESFLDSVQNLARDLEAASPEVGIVGLGTRNVDGTIQPTAGPEPRLFSTLLRLMLPRSKRKAYLMQPIRQASVDWVSGCCLLIRQECFESLGGLCPDYFLYYEDVDFCLRARRQGWKVIYEPGITVTHHHPLASRAVSPLLRALTRHALMTFAWKHWPPWQAKLLCRLVQWEARLRNRRQNGSSAMIFHTLQMMAQNLSRGQAHEARQLLDSLVRREEKRRHACVKKRNASGKLTDPDVLEING